MNDTTDASAVFAPLWKRKWLILAVGILVAGASYVYYKRKPPVFTATTQLYFTSGSEEQKLLNPNQAKSTVSLRTLTDQAALINSSIIGEPVHRRLREEHRLAAAHGKSKATPAGASSFIAITTEARSPKAAVQLANAYAQTYIKRQHAGFEQQVKAAIATTRKQLRAVETGKGAEPTTSTAHKGKGSTPARSVGAVGGSSVIQAANLTSKLNQLESDLSVSSVQQVGTAKATALPISPHPKKNAIFGFVVGVLLACVAAYAVSRFDRRLRSLGDIEDVFQTQILTALPTVRKPIVTRDGQRRPAAALLEPMRRLQTTLQLGDMLEHDRAGAPRSILFLSADAGDGKSTLIANLALVQRDAGEETAVIEADFRRPVLARLLGTDAPHGLADVLAGTLAFGDAMQAVAVTQAQASANNSGGPGSSVATVVESRGAGSVSVLSSGGEVANPPALLAGPTMMGVLRSAADEFDYALIDAPPPLEVSDVMPLLHAVDGIVLVARVGHTRAISAQRLVELLKRTSSAPVLGIVANYVTNKDIQRYGFSTTTSSGRRRSRKLIGR